MIRITARSTAGVAVRGAAFLFVALFVAGAAAAHPGVGIVRDTRGNIFYTDLHQVWQIAPDGTKRVAVPGVHTHELYLDAEDNLYGEHLWYEGERTDRWGHYVWRRSPDGRVERILGPREGFRTDFSFVRDAAGNQYWAESGSPVRIRQRAPDGAVRDVAAHPFRDVRWMAAAADGTLYLVDLHDLVRIATDGRVATMARNLPEFRLTQLAVADRHAVMGLAPDAAGNVYVAVYAGRMVKRVTPAGKVSVAARSTAPWAPTGVLAAPDDSFWVLETSVTNSVRVRHILPDGSSRTY
jgi:sugar lactone lactonase YvrE